MSAWTCRSTDGKAAHKIVPPRLHDPSWKGLGADSEEKHEPVSDIDTAMVVDSLKALDPKLPIREADIKACCHSPRSRPARIGTSRRVVLIRESPPLGAPREISFSLRETVPG